MIKRKMISVFGDYTHKYNIILDRQYTVQDFIDEILETYPAEYGYFYEFDYGSYGTTDDIFLFGYHNGKVSKKNRNTLVSLNQQICHF